MTTSYILCEDLTFRVDLDAKCVDEIDCAAIVLDGWLADADWIIDVYYWTDRVI